ncbi:MAG TPA: RluA family pseudouridine synthase [Pseudogracilibacillus sp.]|nr:RluA family pseudouridine synthase [Pseudogracilibacillus sp.]
MKQHRITETEAASRLDKMMKQVEPDYSRQVVQEWIKNHQVKVNQKHVKANYICQTGDEITWTIPEVETVTIEPEAIPLDIQYEDDDILVINKPKGMLIHPTATIKTNTIVNALKNYTAALSTLSGDDRPGIVHRLDQDTSGLILVAKHNAAHQFLKEQFQARTITRVYEAVVYGKVEHRQGIIKAPIGRNPNHRKQMAVTDDGREAETHFQLLTSFEQYSHLECELKTGRTHQIRVHLQYMNHPILGDSLYAKKQTNLINGQALFAKRLTFSHPRTKKQINFEIDAPADFQHVLDVLASAD